MKIPFKLLLLSGLIALQGCVASSYVQDNLLTKDEKLIKISDQDNMIAIGVLKDQNQTTDMLFIGEKYTYMVNKGGPELLKLIQNVPVENRILLTHVPIALAFKDQTQFSGVLQFKYRIPVNQLSDTQVAQLKEIGFNRSSVMKDPDGKNNTYLSSTIHFSGTQYQGISTEKIQHKLNHPYPLQLNKTIVEKEKNNPAKSLMGVLLMPVAIGVDLVTFPVAIGVVGYGLTHKEPFK